MVERRGYQYCLDKYHCSLPEHKRPPLGLNDEEERDWLDALYIPRVTGLRRYIEAHAALRTKLAEAEDQTQQVLVQMKKQAKRHRMETAEAQGVPLGERED